MCAVCFPVLCMWVVWVVLGGLNWNAILEIHQIVPSPSVMLQFGFSDGNCVLSDIP